MSCCFDFSVVSIFKKTPYMYVCMEYTQIHTYVCMYVCMYKCINWFNFVVALRLWGHFLAFTMRENIMAKGENEWTKVRPSAGCDGRSVPANAGRTASCNDFAVEALPYKQTTHFMPFMCDMMLRQMLNRYFIDRCGRQQIITKHVCVVCFLKRTPDLSFPAPITVSCKISSRLCYGQCFNNS